jgi:hypothetical protein
VADERSNQERTGSVDGSVEGEGGKSSRRHYGRCATK